MSRQQLINHLSAKTLDLSNNQAVVDLYSYRKTHDKESVDDKDINDTVIRLLKTEPKRTMKKLIPLIDPKTLERISFVRTIPVGPWNMIGCPLSTDYDVVVQVETAEQLDPLYGELDMKELFRQMQSAGYDPESKKIDCSLAYIENGNIRACSKGSKQFQNTIFSTYKHHKQLHPCIVSCEIPLEMEEKVQALAKYVLNYLRELLDPVRYNQERDNRIRIMQGGHERIDYAMEILLSLPNPTIESTQSMLESYRSAVKALAMKMLQIIILDTNPKGPMYYTKQELAKEYARLFTPLPSSSSSSSSSSVSMDDGYQNESLVGFEESAGMMWLLTRGVMGVPDPKCWERLVKNACLICTEYRSSVSYDWKPFQLNLSIPPPVDLPSSALSAFFESPLKVSDRFLQVVPNLFSVVQDGCTIAPSGLDALPENIKKCFDPELAQRSREWYSRVQSTKEPWQIAKSSTTLKDMMESESRGEKTHFNLLYIMLRGCIIEQYVIQGVDFNHVLPVEYTNVSKTTVGMMIPSSYSSEPGSSNGMRPVCPDLLLTASHPVHGRVIIPVEIKTAPHAPGESHRLRRIMRLAKLQVKSCVDIIRSESPETIVPFGIVSIVFVYKNSQGEIVMDGQSTIVHI